MKNPKNWKDYNKKSTPEEDIVAKKLTERGWKVKQQWWDGKKTVDIFIPQKNAIIEVDGNHHLFNWEQALSDLWRVIGSKVDHKFETIRILNSIVNSKGVDKGIDAIDLWLNNRPDSVNYISRKKPKTSKEKNEIDNPGHYWVLKPDKLTTTLKKGRPVYVVKPKPRFDLGGFLVFIVTTILVIYLITNNGNLDNTSNAIKMSNEPIQNEAIERNIPVLDKKPVVPVCGNGVVEIGENCLTCSKEVKCSLGETCRKEGVCKLLDPMSKDLAKELCNKLVCPEWISSNELYVKVDPTIIPTTGFIDCACLSIDQTNKNAIGKTKKGRIDFKEGVDNAKRIS
ncbi:MAG: hypothetical protein Q8R00_02560 [Candidatus Nanoarchaeia archaeon]|nr:hypothetical protein [Candidatus Nanoarchaeia archaeon]